jgi:valyl-tRNA synthetase
METTYDPKNIESRWNQYWNQHDLHRPNSQNSTPYAIVLPPPNVTGSLHMGHGFQLSLMDTLIRRKRMQGYNTLWQPGTDHAGIATQMVVERELAKDGKNRHDLGREKFIDKVWEWQKQSGGKITEQMHRMGSSLAWDRAEFSMDPKVSHATNEAFIRLFNEGLIYRGKRLVNWDPILKTAISDLEVINEEKQGSLWHIRYDLSDNTGYVTVATTRPETLLGDSAVAVHPDDKRYQHLIGKQISLPLTNRKIPVIADEYVDKDFGSGCVKITPAHDFNDYDMGLRHNLTMYTILTPEAALNKQVPEPYIGLDRFVARKQIVKDLEEKNLIEKIEPHTLKVPMGDRSGAVIEPMLTDQWFIKMESLAKPAIDAIHTKELRLVPESWNKTYLQWLENIQDWCISRQLWWGHRIPVWYDDTGKPFVGHNEKDVRSQHNLDDTVTLTQESDVLDTWFTAALWPFSSMGWPNENIDLNNFYPGNVLVTGFDIIFFWVARMVMMGIKLMGKTPFHEVYIHGLIRDGNGQKMSKSKGNIIDPIDLIDGISLEDLIAKRTKSVMQKHLQQQVAKNTPKEFPNGITPHGTDALRFTFCALASTGRDINFDLGRTEGYRNFCNKLWNAARFVLMNTEDFTLTNKPNNFSTTDLWIQSQLNKTIASVNNALDKYRFDIAAKEIYEFTWNEYCTWYVELAKCQLNNQDTTTDSKEAIQYNLLSILETLLRLIHPIMPFITEEIWQTIKQPLQIETKSIMIAAYPKEGDYNYHSDADNDITWLKQVVGKIRNIRSEMNVSPAKNIECLYQHGTKEDVTRINQYAYLIKSLAKLKSLTKLPLDQTPPASATSVIGKLELHLPLAGTIDKDAETSRLNKELAKLQKEKEKCEVKLNNPNYISRAPAQVVTKEQDRLTHIKAMLVTLEEKRSHILKL